jgi:hypothetical protein
MKTPSPACAAFFAILAAVSRPALGADKITETAIRDYYKQSMDVLKEPYDVYYGFMEKSMTDDFVSAMEMKTTVEGGPPQPHTDRQTKASLLAGAKEAYDAVKEAQLSYEIKSIDVAADGLTASAIADLTIKNLSVPAGHGQILLGTSTGECRDDFILSPAGVLQLRREDCSADLAVSKGQGL